MIFYKISLFQIHLFHSLGQARKYKQGTGSGRYHNKDNKTHSNVLVVREKQNSHTKEIKDPYDLFCYFL